jgi:mono/diheme cytochrome c family protein
MMSMHGGMRADSGHRGMMPMHPGMHADSGHRGMMMPGCGGMRPMHGGMPRETRPSAPAGESHASHAAQLVDAAPCPPATPALVEQGRALFTGRGNCAACHGVEGRGTGMAPDLTDGEWLHGDGSYASIAQITAAGVPRPLRHPAPMPPRGGAEMSAAEVCAVAAYVRSRVP